MNTDQESKISNEMAMDCMAAQDQRFSRHARHPQNRVKLPNANGLATGVGSCGDRITVELRIESGRIMAIGQTPCGCVYTVACGSAMSILAKGGTINQALNIEPEDVASELGGLPDDHLHCARLAVNTLGEAIADYYAET